MVLEEVITRSPVDQFQRYLKNSRTGNSIAPWTFLFYMTMFYMQYKGREKAAKVVEFVARWLNLCLSTVIHNTAYLFYKLDLVQC